MLSNKDRWVLFAILIADIITFICITTSMVLLFSDKVVVSFVFLVLSCGSVAFSVYTRNDFAEYCKNNCIKVDKFWFRTPDDNDNE